jgi:hypothetical protein
LVVCCAVGGILIGFFANQLNTVVGCVLFALGILMMAASAYGLSRKEKEPASSSTSSEQE